MLRAGPLQNLRAGVAHCEEAFRTSGEHPRAGLFLFEAYAMMGKRPFAIALGKRIAGGDAIEAGLVRQLLKEFGVDVPAPPSAVPMPDPTPKG
jgi:hypothetical protein